MDDKLQAGLRAAHLLHGEPCVYVLQHHYARFVELLTLNVYDTLRAINHGNCELTSRLISDVHMLPREAITEAMIMATKRAEEHMLMNWVAEHYAIQEVLNWRRALGESDQVTQDMLNKYMRCMHGYLNCQVCI